MYLIILPLQQHLANGFFNAGHVYDVSEYSFIWIELFF